MSDTSVGRVSEELTTVIATGTIGPRGPIGPDGLQGDQGERGPQGDTGTNQAVFGKDGDLVVEVGTGRWIIIGSQIIVGVIISVGTAPTGSDIIVDINQNGATVFTSATKPTISAGSNTSSIAVPDIIYLSDGDYITVDIDQVGSTIAGSTLTVQIIFQ